MDAYLKRLADAGLALSDAEEAAGAGETGQATEAIDRAEEELTALREAKIMPRASGRRGAVPPRRCARVSTASPDPLCRSGPPSAKGRPSSDPDEEIDPARAA